MIQCFLCLEAKEDIADFIQIKSSTWEELNVEDIIQKHLWPSIIIKPKSQWFCLMCWNKLQDFHNFYVCIENAQVTQKNIFNISHENTTIQTECESQNEGEWNNHGTSLVSVSMDSIVPTSINIVKQEVEFISDNELEQHYNSSPDGMIDDNCDDTMSYAEPPVIGEELTSDDDTDYVKSQTRPSKSPEGDPTDIISTTYYYQSRLSCRFHDLLLSRHIPLKCSNCELRFGTFIDLKNHSTEAHNKPAIIVCCGTEFDNRLLLVDHICCHINTQYFRCGVCPKVLTDRLAFKGHKRHHENERDTTCVICNIKLYKKCYMDFHKLTHADSDDKQMHCKECGVFFTNENQLSHHMKMVHSIEMCIICGKLLTTAEALQLHLNRHDSPLRCNYCGVRVSNKIQLNKHFIEKHTLKKGPKSYICQVCNRVSASAIGLKRHVQRNHTTGLPHKCEFCYKTFKSIDYLQIHLKTHAGFEENQIHRPEDNNYACPKCNQCFSCEYLLLKHVKSVHDKEKYQICGEVLPDIEAVRRHLEKHDDLTVSTEGDLEDHLKLKQNKNVEGTNSNRICPICNKISITVNALRQHIRRNHRSCQVNKCPRCNKAFKRKEKMQEHIKNKVGCNLYKCPFCPKAFDNVKAMRRHRRGVHAQEKEENE